MKYLLGLDLGSGSVKATIIDQNGKHIAEASSEYPTYYPESGWAEQDPKDWYYAAVQTLRQLFADGPVNPDQIEALAVDAATHTAVLLDEQNQPLDRAIFWTDQRSASQAKWLN